MQYLEYAAGDQADDPGPVDQLREDVGQVGQDDDDQGLENPGAGGQTQDEAILQLDSNFEIAHFGFPYAKKNSIFFITW